MKAIGPVVRVTKAPPWPYGIFEEQPYLEIPIKDAEQFMEAFSQCQSEGDKL